MEWGLNLGGVRYFASVQTSPGAHPASCTVDIGCPSWVVKQPGNGSDLPPPGVPRLKQKIVVPLLPLLSFIVFSRVNFMYLTI